MMRSFFILLAGSVLVLSACSSNGDSSPAIGGTYTGSYTSLNGFDGTITVVISNAISDSPFLWSASGMVDQNGSDTPVVMEGTGEYVFPDIAFTVNGSGRILFGTVSGGGSSISASQDDVLVGAGTEERFEVTL